MFSIEFLGEPHQDALFFKRLCKVLELPSIAKFATVYQTTIGIVITFNNEYMYIDWTKIRNPY